MKPMPVVAYRKFLLLFSTFTVILFVFSHSLMSAEASGAVSEGFHTFLDKWLGHLPFYSHAFLRKAAHFLEYTLLGIHAPFYRVLWRKGEAALALCFLVPFLDERLQSLVPGRAPLWQDVLLDSVGVAFGCLLALVFLFVLRGRRKKGGRS